ncbi:MAG: FapA family protein [Lachnospiraceae bacterium]|nr:FapA family protein [Lachnospiraceae bacterium]
MDIKEKLLLLKEGFSKEQVEEISKGEASYLDTSIYAKKEFLSLQMKEIRVGMEEGLDVDIYARPDFDWLQMAEIRLGLEHNDDVRKYAYPKVKHDIMKEIRLGLEEGINLASYSSHTSDILREIRAAHRSEVDILDYVDRGYDAEQLKEIRLALEHHVSISAYLKPEYRGISLREIRIGLERQVNVEEYAFLIYDWRQMRELRLGLEHQINIDHYRNALYSWRQMREIRLGLELGLKVSRFTSFMYTANEMKKRREYMLSHMSEEFKGEQAPVIINYDNFAITISDDESSATIRMHKWDEDVTREAVIRMLRDQNIVFGIKEDVAEELAEGKHLNENVVIAKGQPPVPGKDGYYEFFIKTEINREPKILDDGSIDYHNIEWFQQVSKDQKLAYYHDATEGVEGCTVTGRKIPYVAGKQLSVIGGEGFRLDDDRKTYYSNMDGLVEFKKDLMIITNVLVLDEVTAAMGNVVFNGAINIKGNVQAGSYISAAGEIYISGAVEGAVIEAEGDIVIKQGINASKKGSIKSRQNISSRFIESAIVRAEGDINANYILNSIVTSRKKIKISGRMGSIIGGVTYATDEINVHNVGNDAFVKTILKVGLDDEMVREQVRCEKQLAAIDKELESLHKLHDQLNEMYKGTDKRTNDLFVKIESSVFSKNEEKKMLLESQGAINELIKRTAKSKVIISGTAYENSVVEVNGKRWISNGARDVTLKSNADNQIDIHGQFGVNSKSKWT